MIARQGGADGESREIAGGLAGAVRAALAARGDVPDEARELAWRSAMDIAELLELPGLGALLAACAAHAAHPPLAVANVMQRLARLAHETGSRGEIAPFAEADHELASLAGVLESQEWGRPDEPAAPGEAHAAPATPGHAVVSTESLAELVADLELDRPEALAEVQVSMPVAAALRAAIDWMGAELGGPVRVQVQEAALQLSVRPSHEPGLRPAGAVLASAKGALLAEPDGRWALRVPLHRDQPAFLLARQGRLALALPWHAVAKLRIADDASRMMMTEPSLAPWSALERPEGERPAALLAWGLTRAWLHLDHIVWRVFARPEPVETSDAVPGGRHVVRSQEGDAFEVVDVAEALERVPPLDTPPPHPRAGHLPRAFAPPGPAERRRVAEPERKGVLSGRPGHEGPAELPGSDEIETPGLPRTLEIETSPAPGLPVLGPEHVRPRTRAGGAMGPRGPASGAPVAPRATSPGDSAGTAAPRSASPPAEAVGEPAGRRALIVDDSLVARIGLGRVLEREGWVVEWVERAAEMWKALGEAEWDVVFVDVSLPDASGRAHLQALAAERPGPGRGHMLVALTRDAAEEQLALASGIECTLRKPFAPGVLDRIVRELPAGPRRA